MNNIIGPIDRGDFYTMTMLKESLKLLKERNKQGKFDVAIRCETQILKEYMDKFANKAA